MHETDKDIFVSNEHSCFDLSGFDLVRESHRDRDANILNFFDECLELAKKKNGFSQFQWIDLGSGDGKLNQRMLDILDKKMRNKSGTTQTCKAIFIEPDINSARKLSQVRTAEASACEIEIKQMTATELMDSLSKSPQKQIFDLITVFHVLYYADDWLTFIRKLRCFAKGRYICIALKSGETPLYQKMREAYQQLNKQMPSPFFGEELSKILEAETILFSLEKRESEVILSDKLSDLVHLLSFIWRLESAEIWKLDQDYGLLTEINKLISTQGGKTFQDLHFLIPCLR